MRLYYLKVTHRAKRESIYKKLKEYIYLKTQHFSKMIRIFTLT